MSPERWRTATFRIAAPVWMKSNRNQREKTSPRLMARHSLTKVARDQRS